MTARGFLRSNRLIDTDVLSAGVARLLFRGHRRRYESVLPAAGDKRHTVA